MSFLQANLKDTFDFIVQNSVPPNMSSHLHPGLSTEGEPFHFFYEVLDNIRSVVYEDTNVYHPQIARYAVRNKINLKKD